jgi:ankyrin repeat protein
VVGLIHVDLTCLPQRGWTLLHLACIGGHVEVATLLLTAGAQVDVRDRVSCVSLRVDFLRMDGLPSIVLAMEVM